MASFNHIIVAICTRQRPVMLSRCLAALLQQSIPPGMKYSLLVIENDNEPRSEMQVMQLQTTTPVSVHYRLESDIGIAQARNRALSEALLLGTDWLWFVDDDVVAAENCLRALIEAAIDFDAEVIHGKVAYQYPASDRWGKLSQQALRQRQHGKQIHSAATNNVLFSCRLFSETGLALRFDTKLGLCGGEDTLFFKLAHKNHVVMVFSEKAQVFETVLADRCSLPSLLLRQAGITSSGVYIDQQVMGIAGARAKHRRRLRQNLLQLLAAVIASPIMLLRFGRVREYILSVLTKAAISYGRWRGLHGKLFDSYRQISGI